MTGLRIFVDDARQTPDGFDMCFKDGSTFLDWLSGHPDTIIDMVSLDHDMGAGLDGYDVVKRLAAMPHTIRAIRIHSANPVGAANMRAYAIDAARHGCMPHLDVIEGGGSYPWRRDRHTAQ